MSKSALLKSSIAKKYWMALTGLFLCLFLVGHLAGNLQLILKTGEEGKRAFNEYAYFMANNPAIKILSYLTYISIIFHAVDGIMLAFQNKKARPIPYAHSNPSANSSMASRNMAVLGTLILVFIATHMANFWWKAKISSDQFPLHFKTVTKEQEKQKIKFTYILTTKGEYVPYCVKDELSGIYYNLNTGEPILNKADSSNLKIKNENELYDKMNDIKLSEGYKDLHSLVFAFFGHNKTKEGFPVNNMALGAIIFYTLSMLVLGFHLWHGFSSAFQTLGVNHSSYTPWIKKAGYGFAVIVPLLFAIIPILIFFTK
jgi:succinate dehydrogenase / fumarate reductase cytochrome b subunit